MAFLMMDLQIGGLNVINKKKYEENFIYTIRQENPLIFNGWDELP